MENALCLIGLVVFVVFLVVACMIMTLIGMDIKNKTQSFIRSQRTQREDDFYDREVG